MGVTINVQNPELCTKKRVDSGGKVYVGNAYADEEVVIIVAKENKPSNHGE